MDYGRALEFGISVVPVPLWTPYSLAAAAATMAARSGGKFVLGVGSGDIHSAEYRHTHGLPNHRPLGMMRDAIEAMGGPRRSPGEAVEALEEAIQLIRRAWAGEEGVRLEGKHYRASGYRAGPPPAHSVEIWVGAYKPRMLRLIGRVADGWLPSLGRASIEEIGSLHQTIDQAARGAGRDPAAIRRLLNFGGVIGQPAPDEGGLGGSIDDWVERLAGWATEFAIDTFIFWPALTDPSQVQLWGEQIAARVKTEVEQRRARVN